MVEASPLEDGLLGSQLQGIFSEFSLSFVQLKLWISNLSRRSDYIELLFIWYIYFNASICLQIIDWSQKIFDAYEMKVERVKAIYFKLIFVATFGLEYYGTVLQYL